MSVSKIHPVYGTLAVALWVATLFCVALRVMYGPLLATFAIVTAVMAATCTIVAFIRGGHEGLMAHRMELTGRAVEEITERVTQRVLAELPSPTVQIQPIPAFIRAHRIYASAPVPPPVPPMPTLDLRSVYRDGYWKGYSDLAEDALAPNDSREIEE